MPKEIESEVVFSLYKPLLPAQEPRLTLPTNEVEVQGSISPLGETGKGVID